MKALTRKTLAALLAVAMVITAVGATVNTADAKKAKVKKITLSVKKKTLTVGGTCKLKVKSVNPKKASKAVTWKSGNKSVATVNAKGKVVAKQEGTATITATSKSNKKAKATCKITVKAAGTVTTEPSTEPSANPSAAPSQNPPAASTNPGTEPSTNPGTEPSTNPSTEPSTNPSTEPSTNPSTEPSTNPSTEPSTNPSTEPSTAPSTEPAESYEPVEAETDAEGNAAYTITADDSYKMTVTKGGKEEEVAFTQEDIEAVLEDAVDYDVITEKFTDAINDKAEVSLTQEMFGETLNITLGEASWNEATGQWPQSAGRDVTIQFGEKTYSFTEGKVQQNLDTDGNIEGSLLSMKAPEDKADEYGFEEVEVFIKKDGNKVVYEIKTDQADYTPKAQYNIEVTADSVTVIEKRKDDVWDLGTVFSYADNKITIAEKYAAKFGLSKKKADEAEA